MKIQKLTDPAFKKYGKVVDFIDTAALAKSMEQTEAPDGVVYVPSVPALEATDAFSALSQQFYGGMPIQIGYCNGKNHTLNAVEYHRDSELNYALTDIILLIGSQQDVDPADFTYDTAKMEAFLAPAGSLVEFHATTLHYAPISVGDAFFKVAVVLPKGTNEPLAFAPAKQGEPKLLTATNKWLIAHPESGIQDAHAGLVGENITL